MIESLEKIDQQLLLFFNSLHAPWLDPVFFLISYKLTWIPLYLIILIYCYKKSGWKLSLLVLLSAVLTVALCDLISVHAFKNIFERYRPSHNEDIGHLVHIVRDFSGQEIRGGYFGFISSHATNHFGLAVIIGLLLRSWSKSLLPLLLIWAAVVAYSRIYMGLHYPADVFVGAIVGSAIGWAVFQISKRFLPIIQYRL